MSSVKTEKEEFIILKNGARFSKVRAESFEVAKGAARKKYAHEKGGYFEIRTADGRFVPLF